MFPPFPTELAHQYCLKLISQIKDGTVVLKQISKESEERKGQGIMLGCLVACDKKKSKKEDFIYCKWKQQSSGIWTSGFCFC